MRMTTDMLHPTLRMRQNFPPPTVTSASATWPNDRPFPINSTANARRQHDDQQNEIVLREQRCALPRYCMRRARSQRPIRGCCVCPHRPISLSLKICLVWTAPLRAMRPIPARASQLPIMSVAYGRLTARRDTCTESQFVDANPRIQLADDAMTLAI